MKKTLVAAVLTAFAVVHPNLYAAVPPPIPANRLVPPIPAGPDPKPVLPPLDLPKGPSIWNLNNIGSCEMSGLVCYGILQQLKLQHTIGSASRAISTAYSPVEASHHRTIMPDATAYLPPSNISSDADLDIEPAVMAISVSSVDTTVSAYPRYINGNTYRMYFSRTTDLTHFTSGPMAGLGGYLYHGDPAMAENSYAGGVAPQRMYCAGIAFNDLQQPESQPNAIVLWHADQPGYGFDAVNPTTVDSRFSSATSRIFLDKPAVAVSQHNSSDLGYVYAAYTSFDYTSRNTAILIARSTDGGASFPVKTGPIAYGGDPNPQPPGTPITTIGNPQIFVSPGTGYVYVLWVDFGANALYMATSTDYGLSFGTHELVATGTMATARDTSNRNGLFRAETAPVATFDYNTGTGVIIVTWHDFGANGLDVEYAYRDSTGWHRPSLPIVQFTANDQFFPALDYNLNGSVVVTYYDRHTDGRTYRPYVSYIDHTGSRIDASDHDLAGFDTNPGFIGDFQSVWDWVYYSVPVEQAVGTWIGNSGGSETYPFDVFLTRITY